MGSCIFWGQKLHTTDEKGLEQPYPATLMAGLYAIADSSKPTRVDLDNELEGMYNMRCLDRTDAVAHLRSDVRWYPRADILDVLERYGPVNWSLQNERSPDAPLGCPDTNAIGGVLISEWAYGRAGPGAIRTR